MQHQACLAYVRRGDTVDAMRTTTRRTPAGSVVIYVAALSMVIGGCTAQAPKVDTATLSGTAGAGQTTLPAPANGVYSTEETWNPSLPTLPPAAEDRFLVILQEVIATSVRRIEGDFRDVPVSRNSDGASVIALGRDYCFSRGRGMQPLAWLESYAEVTKGRGDYEAVLIAYGTTVAAVYPDSLCPETAVGGVVNDDEMIAIVEEAWEWPNNPER